MDWRYMLVAFAVGFAISAGCEAILRHSKRAKIQRRYMLDLERQVKIDMQIREGDGE